MARRLSLVIFLLVFCANSAWPKWKEEEQKYLDDQFQALQQQIQALKTQVDGLTAHLAQLLQNQAQLQQAMVRQLRALQDAQQLLTTMRMGGEENYSNLKASIGQLRAEQQKSFSTLLGQPVVAGPSEVVTPVRSTPVAPASQVVQGYITVVEGNLVTVDLGSSRGIHTGSRLVVYKAGDPNSRVGVLEVTQVVDRDNSKAQIVTMSPGVKPEFSDIVRLE